MKVLIADDDLVSLRILEHLLISNGYEVSSTDTGSAAWEIIQKPTTPQLVILDWKMPGLNGVEICSRLKKLTHGNEIYIIILTVKGNTSDIVKGLSAGASDYIIKPFKTDELLVRLNVGKRIVELKNELKIRVKELEKALDRVKKLEGFLPICSYCKKIKHVVNDQKHWDEVEKYVSEHSEVVFTHSICPDCYEKYVKPELEEMNRLQKNKF